MTSKRRFKTKILLAIMALVVLVFMVVYIVLWRYNSAISHPIPVPIDHSSSD